MLLQKAPTNYSSASLRKSYTYCGFTGSTYLFSSDAVCRELCIQSITAGHWCFWLLAVLALWLFLSHWDILVAFGQPVKQHTFKGSNFLDIIARIQNVVMDKTGTMTEGVFFFFFFKSAGSEYKTGFKIEEILAMVNALESQDYTPVATAIQQYIR